MSVSSVSLSAMLGNDGRKGRDLLGVSVDVAGALSDCSSRERCEPCDGVLVVSVLLCNGLAVVGLWSVCCNVLFCSACCRHSNACDCSVVSLVSLVSSCGVDGDIGVSHLRNCV